jgi:hypothetical protein
MGGEFCGNLSRRINTLETYDRKHFATVFFITRWDKARKGTGGSHLRRGAGPQFVGEKCLCGDGACPVRLGNRFRRTPLLAKFNQEFFLAQILMVVQEFKQRIVKLSHARTQLIIANGHDP